MWITIKKENQQTKLITNAHVTDAAKIVIIINFTHVSMLCRRWFVNRLIKHNIKSLRYYLIFFFSFFFFFFLQIFKLLIVLIVFFEIAINWKHLLETKVLIKNEVAANLPDTVDQKPICIQILKENVE